MNLRLLRSATVVRGLSERDDELSLFVMDRPEDPQHIPLIGMAALVERACETDACSHARYASEKWIFSFIASRFA